MRCSRFLCCRLTLASPEKSAAFDEQYHLAAGYSYLRTGDFRLATTHPPLAGMVAALPLLLREDIVLPLADPSWAAGNRYDFSDLFLWRANADAPGMLVQARWGITALGLLLLLAIFFWARRMLGARAGWLALVLAVFDPNLIANARLVTTDLPLTAMLVVAAWRLWCWLEGRRWYDLLLAGIFGGLAMAAKYNGLIFWPLALVAALLYDVACLDATWRRSLVAPCGGRDRYGPGGIADPVGGLSRRLWRPDDSAHGAATAGALLLGSSVGHLCRLAGRNHGQAGFSARPGVDRGLVVLLSCGAGP